MSTAIQPPVTSTRRTIFPRSASTGCLRRVTPTSPKKATGSKAVKVLLPTPIPEDDDADHAPPAKPLKSCLSVGNKLSSLGGDSPENKMKKSVSFHAIEIREHPRALGDHPATSGPALSLGWYTEEEGSTISLPLDDYETARPARRDRRSLSVPRKMREDILKEEAGVTTRDIAQAQREAARIQHSRRVTNATRDYDSAHYILESCVRKVKRLMGSKKMEKDLMKQAKRAQEMQKLRQQRWSDTANQAPLSKSQKESNESELEQGEEAPPSSEGAEDPPMKPKRQTSPKRSQQDTATIPKSISDSFLPPVETSDAFTASVEADEEWEF